MYMYSVPIRDYSIHIGARSKGSLLGLTLVHDKSLVERFHFVKALDNDKRPMTSCVTWT